MISTRHPTGPWMLPATTSIPGETACRSGISGRGGGCGLHGNLQLGADPRPQAALEELRTLAEAEETEVG